MVAQWHFPPDATGNVRGIADRELGGKESPLSTLVREVCQNSKDAKNSSPARVEFHMYSLDTSQIPDVRGLRTAIEYCAADARREFKNNMRTAETFESMLKVLSGPEVHMLRISDFNTTGLKGSDSESYTTPWNSFIFGSGVSDKSGESGGSRGRGKDSICAMSSINTVFYSTLDEDGNEASIGCSYLITHTGPDGERLSDVGRFHKEGEGFSHRQLSLDPSFVRTKSGTDIFVVAFDRYGEDESEIALTVLRDYFVAILDGELEVVVNGTVIDRYSAKRILGGIDRSVDESGTVDFVSEMIECYEAGPVHVDSNYEIYLKESENNAIVSVRSGMTIDRDFYKPRGRNILGAVVIRSPWASKILISSETASHDSWDYKKSPDEYRISVKSLIDDIKRTALDCIKDMEEDEGADRRDAVGLESYLPMSGDSSAPDVAEKEYLFDPISRTFLSRRPIAESQPADVSQNSVKPTSPSEESQDGLDEWNGPVHASDDGSKPDPSPMTNIRPGTDESFKRVFRERSVTLGNLRTFCTDSSKNVYRVVFDVTKPCSVYLEARVFSLYRDKAEPVPIAEAYDSNGNGLPVSKSRIGPIDANGGSRNFLTVVVDYPVTGRITVVAIENQEAGYR